MLSIVLHIVAIAAIAGGSAYAGFTYGSKIKRKLVAVKAAISNITKG